MVRGKWVPDGTENGRYIKQDGKWVYRKVGWSHEGRPRKNDGLTRIQRYKRKLREDLMDIYGWACACCGEDNPIFLTFDHINNDGNKHRAKFSGDGVLRDMRDNPDTSKYQVLCFNCNFGKNCNGGICPHLTCQ